MLDRVEWLSAGFCMHPELMSIRGGSWKPCPFPAGFLLVEHARHGICLFDTGYSDHFHAATRPFPERFYAWVTPPRFVAADRAVDQLRARGIAAGDVRYIVVSHFHADHIAGLRDFPRAKIVCSASGYRSIRDTPRVSGILNGLLPSLMPADSDDRVLFVEEMRSVPLVGAMACLGAGRDLVGDGSMIVVDLPGHAVGQLGLFLPEMPRGSLLLAADAAWSLPAITGFRAPPRFVTALLGETAAYLDTLKKLGRIAATEPHLAICPSHGRLS